jgi:Fur family peroxide stress response transcriptional regulator
MEANPKHFRKRDAILECLMNTDTHPSAEMVHQMLQQSHPDISQATVYRNLALFKKQGRIASVATVSGIERFDANTAPHVHFICQTCGAVMDLPGMEVPQQLCRNAAEEAGGKIQACQLTFTGTCSACCQNNYQN